MSTSSDGILAAIDNAVWDVESSPDAMRWAPEPPAERPLSVPTLAQLEAGIDLTPGLVAVMDAHDPAQGTPALDHRLAWLRSEGIDPDTTRRVEVYLQEDGMYAEVTSHGPDDRAYETTGGDGELITSKRRQAVSSAPPPETATHTLDARVTGTP